MPYIDMKLDEIPLEAPLRLEHAGTAIVVIRTEAGISAFPDSCPHAHWPISEGEVIDGVLQCPGHGWQFDVATGRCLNAPVYCLKPLAVVTCADNVHVEWD
jgi:nitrite reductase/ring-hydroxylating ferredoxin subunit